MWNPETEKWPIKCTMNEIVWKEMLVFVQDFMGNEQDKNRLKMLGLYLDTFIIGHKLCNLLSILNEFTLQK